MTRAEARLDLTRSQILAFRRHVGALDVRLPPGPGSLHRAAWTGLQDSMPRAAVLSIHARVERTKPSTWEDPSLVQLWGPRFSVFVVAACDLAIFSLGTLPDDANGRQRAEDLAARLRAVLGDQRIAYGEAGKRLGVYHNRLRYAAATGTVLIRWEGARQPTVWIGPTPDMSPREARLELARSYLHGYGPTTSEAFGRWAGIGPRPAGAAFEALGASLVPVRTPVGDAWILSQDEAVFRAEPGPAAPVRLLPSGDAFFLLQGADRDLLVPDAHRQRELWTPRVWPGALLVDGEVTGTWRRAGAVLVVQPWRRLSAAERNAVEAEAASLPLPGISAPVMVRSARALTSGVPTSGRARFLALRASCCYPTEMARGKFQDLLGNAAGAPAGRHGVYHLGVQDGRKRLDAVDQAGAGADDEPVGVDRPHRQARQFAGDQLRSLRAGEAGGGISGRLWRTTVKTFRNWLIPQSQIPRLPMRMALVSARSHRPRADRRTVIVGPPRRHAMESTVLGYPRIGPQRELKKATEAFWAGRETAADLEQTAAALRLSAWETLRDAGLSDIPSNTFSLYDHVLDTAVMVNAVPKRFAAAVGLDAYFAMARGADGIAPLELTKWFDTNYHYLVPELEQATDLRLAGDKPVREYLEAREHGIETRPVLLGPVSFLLLSKAVEPGFAPLDLLDPLLGAYEQLLAELHAAGAQWVQLDEPALAADRTAAELEALRRAYHRLGSLSARPRGLLVSTYFGEIGDALAVLAQSPIEAIGLDFVAGPGNLEALAAVGGIGAKTLVAGVVDGRNVWRGDLPAALSLCASLLGLAGQLTVSTSCSLLHVPLDLDAETSLAPELSGRLAFARQKVDEVVALGRWLNGDRVILGVPRKTVPVANADVRERLDALGDGQDRSPYAIRQAAQARAHALPTLPTTTIGSFPQTAEIRAARAGVRAGHITADDYEAAMRAEIDRVIALQEEIGLDVLVHGEPERNDMVQYFAEQLDGYAATENGWVQSYGTRYVRPPILHGDVSRPRPITVGWARYAQSRTDRPVKGMLTGPVTMLSWSFVRDDQPLSETAREVALAVRDEIADLEAAGIRIIQVDEAALRELLPLRRADRDAYLAWAVAAFRLATSGAADATQIHTHMCYSEFGEIIDAIAGLDADVTTVEAARSRMEFIADLTAAGFARGIGPGVWDIHSPRVPDVEEIAEALTLAIGVIGPARLWVNPDCGLKTRGYAETEAALRNLVEAARQVRAGIAS